MKNFTPEEIDALQNAESKREANQIAKAMFDRVFADTFVDSYAEVKRDRVILRDVGRDWTVEKCIPLLMRVHSYAESTVEKICNGSCKRHSDVKAVAERLVKELGDEGCKARLAELESLRSE